MREKSTTLETIDRSKAITLVKEYVRSNPQVTFRQALSDDLFDSELALAGLAYCLGFPFVSSESTNEDIHILGRFDTEKSKELVRLNLHTNELTGDLSVVVSKTFAIIANLEHRLNDAIFYPPDMRQREIQEVCDEVGVDTNTYRTILSNAHV